MKTIDEIRQLALKTQDPAKLFALIEDALDVAKFYESRAEFSRLREAKLVEQVKRQTSMIDNLEKTLWKK